jgi:hypothetical protein
MGSSGTCIGCGADLKRCSCNTLKECIREMYIRSRELYAEAERDELCCENLAARELERFAKRLHKSI